jgi:hypothetical protein
MVIGIVVVIIIIMIFRQQAGAGAKKISDIGKEAELSGEKCANIILNRACASRCDETKGQRPVYSPAGVWKDCQAKGMAACCETF